jgi:hypothetical protein
MGEHKIPRDRDIREPETFAIHEAATGTSTPIREATEEQLQRAKQAAEQQHRALAQQVIQLLGQSTNCAKAAAAIEYELDRRKRTITIATDLTSITGLRRQ